MSSWLAEQLEERGWSVRELARRSGVSHTTINKIVNGVTNPTADICIGVARALGEDPERFLRRAGKLPLKPPTVADAAEAADIISRLDEQSRRNVMTMLRSLDSRPPPPQPALEQYKALAHAFQEALDLVLAGDTIQAFYPLAMLLTDEQRVEFLKELDELLEKKGIQPEELTKKRGGN